MSLVLASEDEHAEDSSTNTMSIAPMMSIPLSVAGVTGSGSSASTMAVM